MAARLIWVDGRICSAEEFRMEPTDEVILYGRGLFETTRTFGGRPWLWEKHLERALNTARAIGIELSPNELPPANHVAEFAKEVSDEDLVVRLSVGAGSNKSQKKIWMTTRPLPSPANAISLFRSRYRVSRGDELAGLKTINYLLRQLAFEEATEQGTSDTPRDALLLSTDGEVLETAHSNIFARMGDEWWTPPIAGGVLPGTVRSLLLESAESLGIREKIFHIDELTQCDEVVVTNSVRGIVSVAAIDGRPFTTTNRIEPLTVVIARSQTELR